MLLDIANTYFLSYYLNVLSELQTHLFDHILTVSSSRNPIATNESEVLCIPRKQLRCTNKVDKGLCSLHSNTVNSTAASH